MCGIFAHVVFNLGRKRSALIQTMVNGLKRLEYRGYDSAGLACDGQGPEDPLVIKEVGTIDKLENRIQETLRDDPRNDYVIDSHVGIAHTRWATHGPPSRANSHPHSSDAGNEFLVVHNGIITNHSVLRDMLQSRGVSFSSETDTETVAKLTKFLYDELIASNPTLAFPRLVMEVMRRVEGAYAFVFRSKYYPNELVACRLGSPMVVGTKLANGFERRSVHVTMVPQVEPSLISETINLLPSDDATLEAGAHGATSPRWGTKGEFLFSSDASAIVEHTDKVFYMEDNDVVHVKDGKLLIYNVQGDSKVPQLAVNRAISTLPLELDSIMRGNFQHFMLKEIYEQPEALTSAMRGRIKRSAAGGDFEIHLGGVKERLRDILTSTRIIFVACGSSYHACLAARQVMEELTDIPIAVELASDFNDRKCPLFRSDTCVFLSQSGETKDTLESLSYAKKRDAVTVGVVNVVGSEISRMTSCGMHLNAGCEIGVASTKAYTCQIVAVVMMALQLSHDRSSMHGRRQQIFQALSKLPSQIEEAVERLDGRMQKLALRLQEEKSILLFGRGFQFATCLEGALKIKEVSYMHTEGIHAGELKHGPLALVDDNMPVIFFTSTDSSRAQTHNALNQVLARTQSGHFVVVCPENDVENLSFRSDRCDIIEVPATVDCLQAILSIIPMQLLSYHLAVSRGHNVDQPRHLAKSVTV